MPIRAASRPAPTAPIPARPRIGASRREVNWNLGGVELTSITAYRDYDNTQAADADYGLADILYFGPKSGRQFKTFTQELRFHGEAFGGKLDWLVGGYYAHEDLDTKSELKFGNDYGRFAACRVVYGSFSAFIIRTMSAA